MTYEAALKILERFIMRSIHDKKQEGGYFNEGEIIDALHIVANKGS